MKKKTIHSTMSIDILDLMRHAMCLGDISGFKVSDFSRLFYCSFVSMFFQQGSNSGEYIVSDDYLKAETSIVSAYSFLMGMILTRYIAEKKYKITNMFHLKDTNISFSKNDSRYPDFFGISARHNSGYLFEAKGRKKRRLGKTGNLPDVEKVKKQLNSVVGVTVTDTNKNFKTKQYTSLNRNIISSVFSKDFIIYDIDPPLDMKNEQSNTIKIELTENDLVYYYNNILPIKNHQDYVELEYKKRRYIGQIFYGNKEFKTNKQTEREKYFIGILKDVYINICEGENVINNHLKYMSSYEKENYSPDNVSIGSDGVILVYFENTNGLLKSGKNSYINLDEHVIDKSFG